MLNRKEFLHGVAGMATAATLVPKARAANPGRRPNVLYVIADEWRAQAFGYMGDTNVRTPAIDRFRNEATSFDQAIAGTPVCCPSRASMMTGDYALTTGVYINDVELKPRNTTLGEAFAAAGYNTGYIGKWHLYGSPEGRYERRLTYIPPSHRFGFDFWKACECSHDYNHSLYYAGEDETPRYWPGFDAVAQTDEAIRFIGEHNGKADPYFMVLSWGPPHFPYMAPKKYSDLYRDRDLALRPNVPEADREAALEELRGYYAQIAVLDDCFGRLMAALEQLGDDNTIVVFASDHGDMALSQGLKHKLYPWAESVRIPFLVRYPALLGRRRGTTDALLDSPDIMPTLLSLAKIAVPAGLQGRDQSYDLRGVAPPLDMPATAFLSMPVPITTARTYGFDAYRGVRNSGFTYARTREAPWLLYNDLQDPFQKHNLIDNPAYAHVQAGLERELDGWLTRLDDTFLTPAEYLKADGLDHYFETMMPVGSNVSPWQDWRSTLQPPANQGHSIDTALAQLLANAKSAEIVRAVAPELFSHRSTRGTMSPRMLRVLAPNAISEAQLVLLDHELMRPDN